jgi:hypothetical protein
MLIDIGLMYGGLLYLYFSHCLSSSLNHTFLSTMPKFK